MAGTPGGQLSPVASGSKEQQDMSWRISSAAHRVESVRFGHGDFPMHFKLCSQIGACFGQRRDTAFWVKSALQSLALG